MRTPLAPLTAAILFLHLVACGGEPTLEDSDSDDARVPSGSRAGAAGRAGQGGRSGAGSGGTKASGEAGRGGVAGNVGSPGGSTAAGTGGNGGAPVAGNGGSSIGGSGGASIGGAGGTGGTGGTIGTAGAAQGGTAGQGSGKGGSGSGTGGGAQGGSAQGGSGPLPIGGTPSLVYFNYTPDGDTQVGEKIRLSVSRRADGRIYLSDEITNAGKVSYYAVNGSVNRVDARKLGEQAIPPNRWIHLVKFVADIDNVNSEGWQTSYQNTGGNGLKWAASFETSFYVTDGTAQAPLAYTEPLWTAGTVTDGLIFKATPTFSLPTSKRYGSESQPIDEPLANLAKVGWNTADDKFRLLYAATVDGLMQSVGATPGQGITTFDDEKLKQAADYLAGATSSSTFAMDYEPHNPAQDAWKWDYASGNFGKTMLRLSELILERHGKRFYSWIGNDTRYSFQGKSVGLDGYNTGGWKTPTTGGVDEAIQIHENPGGISNIERSSKLTQVGFGYTSTVINTVDTPDAPATRWQSPTAWYLRALDVLNIQGLLSQPDEKFLLFLWPFEDLPNDSKRSPMTRFKLPGQQGMMRQTDNRLLYPPNLIRDAIVVHLSNPRVFYTNYWLFPESYDPMQSLNYSRINGVQSCAVANTADFHVYAYDGPDSPGCPAKNAGYMGKDILGVGAMVQGHEIFARHLAGVLDGQQQRAHLDGPFTYRRSDGNQQTAQYKPDTGEHARAFKHAQPWVQVWKNPSTGKRVLFFQDVYAESFEPVTFTVTIGGQTYERTATGNNLYYEVL